MVLNILINIWSAIKFVAISSLTVSSFAGKWLVYLVYHLQSIIYKLLINIFGVLLIAFEDFNIFIVDLWLHISTIIYNLYTFLYIIADKVVYTCTKLKIGLGTILADLNKVFNSIYSGIVGIYTFVVQLCFFIRHYVLLFGSGIWFLFTLVPIGIIYLSSLSVYYAGRLFEETYIAVNTTKNSIKNVFLSIYEFVTDVPVESLLGIMAIICLYYVLAPITKESLMFVYRNLRYIQGRIAHKFSVCKRMLSNYFKRAPTRVTDMRKGVNLNDNACVACQDNERCVLLLPCKHVCLCKDCFQRLPIQYGKRCPICRERVAKSMHIFL